MRCNSFGSPIRGQAELWRRDSGNVWHPLCRWQGYILHEDRRVVELKKAMDAKGQKAKGWKVA